LYFLITILSAQYGYRDGNRIGISLVFQSSLLNLILIRTGIGYAGGFAEEIAIIIEHDLWHAVFFRM
jgi:hypothetical protein